MAGHLDRAAMHTLSTPSPPAGAGHACAACGAPCRRCAEGEPCAQARWCSWCANAYAQNAPAADGLVYCGGPDPDDPAAEHGCGRHLPNLATLIERGLRQYPLYCGECRDSASPVQSGEVPGAAPEVDGDGAAEPEPAEPATAQPDAGEADSGASVRGKRTTAKRSGKRTAEPEPVARTDAYARHLRGHFKPRAGRPADDAGSVAREQHSEMGTGTALPGSPRRFDVDLG